MGEAEEIGGSGGNDPGVLFEFVFELTRAPAGIANEGADKGAGLFVVLDGVFGRDLLDDAQAADLIPPDGSKDEIVLVDRPTVVNADVAERVKRGRGQEIADNLTGGLIENQSECPIFGIVLG